MAGGEKKKKRLVENCPSKATEDEEIFSKRALIAPESTRQHEQGQAKAGTV